MADKYDDLKDIAAESGVISSLIYHPEYYTVDNVLTPKFFYDISNQCLFWAIEKLIESGVENIDSVNLNNMINSNEAIKKTLEKYNLGDVTKFVEFAKFAARATYEEYKLLVENVVTLAYKREVCKFSDGIHKECFNPDNTLDNISNYISDGFNELSNKYYSNNDSVMFGEKVDELWETLCSKRNEDGSVGKSCVVPRVNDFFTFGKGELVLVAGPTGMGKSSFFLNQATHALKNGIATAIIDSELTDDVFFPRLIANLSGVPVPVIKSGKYSNGELEKIEEAKRWLKEQPFIHEYMPTFNKFKTEQLVKKWKNQKDLGLFIYDYIKPGNTYGAAETSQSLGLMADFIKGLAGVYDIATIAGLQLNKLTGQVADSAKPERYGDVLAYWKPKTSEEIQLDGLSCGNFKIEIVKNRNGAVTDQDDYIDVKFSGDYMKITGAECHINQNEDTPFN